jgi:hypothetical protein
MSGWTGKGYSQAVAITPHDSTNFTEGACRAIHVSVAGSIVAIINGAAVTFPTVPAGLFLVEATRVNATGTAATGLVALR